MFVDAQGQASSLGPARQNPQSCLPARYCNHGVRVRTDSGTCTVGEAVAKGAESKPICRQVTVCGATETVIVLNTIIFPLEKASSSVKSHC